ncbi:prefoldin subunit alpha, partial [Thermococci archaeon]
MNEREELNKLLLQMEQYRAQYQAMENQIQTLTLSMAEVNMAKDTLREVGNLKDGQEMLVPIGGNSYLKAKLKEKDRTLIGIGSGV